MTSIIALHDRLFGLINKIAGTWLLPTLARFTFLAVLFFYFINSAKTKMGDGLFGFLSPSDTAYIQIFPKAFEAAGYDSSSLSAFHSLVAVAGTMGELILPVFIVIGLFTRLASVGMIGFVFVQSIVDKYGHGIAENDVGAWFDNASNSLILDQRLLWMVLFIILIIKGAGPISIDRLIKRNS